MTSPFVVLRLLLAIVLSLVAEGVTDKCSDCIRGTCNSELGRCDCPRGVTGPECTEAHRDVSKFCQKHGFHIKHHGLLNCSDGFHPYNPCLNACNGRGTCLAGWCHCDRGFYGGDCSLSMDKNGTPQLLAGLGYQVRRRKPLIYVYELPPSFNTYMNMRTQDRPLWFMIYQRLLSSGIRTADGDVADYFFVPMSIRAPSESMSMVKAVTYIRSHWPWWDRLEGARHLFVHTGDVGRMDMSSAARDVTDKSIFLTHWGLFQDYPFSGWEKSHRPGLDIVLPIYIPYVSPRAGALKHSPLHPLHPSRKNMQQADKLPNMHMHVKRNLEVLFAGRICGGREAPDGTRWPNCPLGINVGYSQGVRQLVHYHHWNRTGFKIRVKDPSYLKDLARTRFCLAPTGGGHGHRQILVTFSGCVPLLIGDFVYQPFEPELDWTRFSVTLPQSDIPRLHEILGDIDMDQYNKMQERLRCGAEHMSFSSFIGGFKWDEGKYDAFETIMEILRVRLLHPGAPPERLKDLDPDFRAFMECRDPGQEEQMEPGELPRRALCTMSDLDASNPASCGPCMAEFKGFVPGGSACCEAENLAVCPRAWE